MPLGNVAFGIEFGDSPCDLFFNFLKFKAGVSNSFNAVGHIYICGFHAGQTLLKKFKQARLYISGHQTFRLRRTTTMFRSHAK